MAAPNYVALNEMKDYLGGLPDAVTTLDTIIEQALSTASRAIDRFCRRRFYGDVDDDDPTIPVRTPRLVPVTSCHTLWVDDIADPDTVTVAFDDTGDGSYSTVWDGSEFQFEPLNGVVDGIEGWPATRLRALSGGPQFPRSYYLRPSQQLVQVTAQWGWAEVPDPIKQATFMTTLDLIKMKGAPFGVVGFDEYGTIRARANFMVGQLLDGTYCRGKSGFA